MHARICMQGLKSHNPWHTVYEKSNHQFLPCLMVNIIKDLKRTVELRPCTCCLQRSLSQTNL
jgi:hypothetical protein